MQDEINYLTGPSTMAVDIELQSPSLFIGQTPGNEQGQHAQLRDSYSLFVSPAANKLLVREPELITWDEGDPATGVWHSGHSFSGLPAGDYVLYLSGYNPGERLYAEFVRYARMRSGLVALGGSTNIAKEVLFPLRMACGGGDCVIAGRILLSGNPRSAISRVYLSSPMFDVQQPELVSEEYIPPTDGVIGFWPSWEFPAVELIEGRAFFTMRGIAPGYYSFGDQEPNRLLLHYGGTGITFDTDGMQRQGEVLYYNRNGYYAGMLPGECNLPEFQGINVLHGRVKFTGEQTWTGDLQLIAERVGAPQDDFTTARQFLFAEQIEFASEPGPDHFSEANVWLRELPDSIVFRLGALKPGEYQFRALLMDPDSTDTLELPVLGGPVELPAKIVPPGYIWLTDEPNPWDTVAELEIILTAEQANTFAD